MSIKFSLSRSVLYLRYGKNIKKCSSEWIKRSTRHQVTVEESILPPGPFFFSSDWQHNFSSRTLIKVYTLYHGNNYAPPDWSCHRPSQPNTTLKGNFLVLICTWVCFSESFGAETWTCAVLSSLKLGARWEADIFHIIFHMIKYCRTVAFALKVKQLLTLQSSVSCLGLFFGMCYENEQKSLEENSLPWHMFKLSNGRATIRHVGAEGLGVGTGSFRNSFARGSHLAPTLLSFHWAMTMKGLWAFKMDFKKPSIGSCV